MGGTLGSRESKWGLHIRNYSGGPHRGFNADQGPRVCWTWLALLFSSTDRGPGRASRAGPARPGRRSPQGNLCSKKLEIVL